MSPRDQAEAVSAQIAAEIPSIADDRAAEAVIDAWTTWLGYVRNPPSVVLADCWSASEADAGVAARIWYGQVCTGWSSSLQTAAERLGAALGAAGLPALAELVSSTTDQVRTADESAAQVLDAGTSIPWWVWAMGLYLLVR